MWNANIIKNPLISTYNVNNGKTNITGLSGLINRVQFLRIENVGIL